MKYILMMQFSNADWKAGNMGNWPPEDINVPIEVRPVMGNRSGDW